LTEILEVVTRLAMVIFIVGSMAAMGLALTIPRIVEPLRDVRLVVALLVANFVVVLHSDGTTGEYFHLERGSVQVRAGQNVSRGQRLARSGNTGFSTAPHLHFGVYRTGRDRTTESLAVRFETRRGTVGTPRSGARYLNPID